MRTAEMTTTAHNDILHRAPSGKLLPEHRPQLRMEPDGWYLSFSYTNDMDYGWAVRIPHSYGGDNNRVEVLAYDMGDEKLVLTNAALKDKVDIIIEHEGGDYDSIIHELRNSDKYVIEDSRSFWDVVADTVARWNALLFLVAPHVACR